MKSNRKNAFLLLQKNKRIVYSTFLTRSFRFAPQVLLGEAKVESVRNTNSVISLSVILCGERRTVRRRVTGGNFFKTRGEKKAQ